MRNYRSLLLRGATRLLLILLPTLLAAPAARVASAAPPTPPYIELPKVEPFKLNHGKKLGKGPRKEHSGIVPSRQWPGVFWMHNDSGDEPRLYAVNRQGEVFPSDRYPDAPGTLVGGAINVDWEDITADDQGHIIIADSGNNENDRRDLALYFLQEPAPTAGRTAYFRRAFFRYPEQREFPAPKTDFNYDAEAWFCLGDQVYALTKRRTDTVAQLYRFDPSRWREGEVYELEHVDAFDFGDQATSAEASPDGKRLVVSTYSSLWLFEVDDAEQPLRGVVSWLPFEGGDDVEAACFADDRTILLGAEAAGMLYEAPIDRFVRVQPAR